MARQELANNIPDSGIAASLNMTLSDATEIQPSRHFAISLYSEVANVYKHNVIPFIPRIMSSILRSLPSSAGSRQLQQACSNVVASVARYTIDPSRDPSSNEEVLYGLCSPLLLALPSKSEPLAIGAAVCLQALVESEKWKCAPLDLQDLMCSQTTLALAEKSTQTVAHMHLMRSLTRFSSIVARRYAPQLLMAGVDILQAASGMPGSWQQRVAAAQLVGSVLKLLDGDNLNLDLGPIMGILEGFLLDKEAEVQAMVETLETGKMEALHKGARVLQSKQHSRRKSSKRKESGMEGFYVLLETQSPNAGTPSRGTVFNSTPTASSGMWQKRSPLRPLKQSPGKPLLTSYGSPGLIDSSRFKENVPVLNPGGQLSKELSSTYQDSKSVRSCIESSGVLCGSKSSRVSFSAARIKLENSSERAHFSRVSVNGNGGIEDHFCIDTRFIMESKNGNQHFMDDKRCSSRYDIVKESRGDVKNALGNVIMSDSNEINCEDEQCKDGFHNFGGCKDRSSSNVMPVTSGERLLCSAFIGFPLTQERSCDTGNSESGENNQIGERQAIDKGGSLSLAPKRLVCSSPRLQGTLGEKVEDCRSADLDTSTERSWSIRENVISCENQEHNCEKDVISHTVSQSGTASSSCCSFEELEFTSEGDTAESKESLGQNQWHKGLDYKGVALDLAKTDFQAMQNQLSVIKDPNNWSFKSINIDPEDDLVGEKRRPLDSFGIQAEFYAKESTELDLNVGSMESSGKTWSLLMKVLNATKRFPKMFAGGVLCTSVIVLLAITMFKCLSDPNDSHVLVPT